NPTMKEKLLAELSSSDLQTAVLVLGQQLRSVNMDGAEVGSAVPEGRQVASRQPALSVREARENVGAGLETLIVGAKPDETDKPGIDLVRSVQTELHRLGCYRMAIDGEWGKGSMRALRDYYRFTGQAEGPLDPNVDLLGELFLRSGRVCKQPVAVKPAVTARAASEDGGSARRSGGNKRKAAPPAPPPPDISAGIGIGGVF